MISEENNENQKYQLKFYEKAIKDWNNYSNNLFGHFDRWNQIISKINYLTEIPKKLEFWINILGPFLNHPIINIKFDLFSKLCQLGYACMMEVIR